VKLKELRIGSGATIIISGSLLGIANSLFSKKLFVRAYAPFLGAVIIDIAFLFLSSDATATIRASHQPCESIFYFHWLTWPMAII